MSWVGTWLKQALFGPPHDGGVQTSNAKEEASMAPEFRHAARLHDVSAKAARQSAIRSRAKVEDSRDLLEGLLARFSAAGYGNENGDAPKNLS